MATPQQVAQAHQTRQSQLATATARAAVQQYGRLDEHALSESWAAGVGQLVESAVTAGQLAAAEAAAPYLAELAAAQGADIAAPLIAASQLAGIASDGRPLASLLYLPIMLIKRLIGEGVEYPQALRRGQSFAAAIASTQVADAGRAAETVGMGADPGWVSYVRVLRLPSCSRCIVLAGREYPWSAGFARHDNCDCVHLAIRHDSPERLLIPTPAEIFASLPRDEQDKRFGKAGAEAIRAGADMGQVVNARRGMTTTAEGRKVTSEGTTKRGVAGRRMGSTSGRKAAVRPMPEQLLEDSGGDRDEFVRQLERFGYLTKPQPKQRRQEQQEPSREERPARVAVPRQREPERGETRKPEPSLPAVPEAPGLPAVPEKAREFHRGLDDDQRTLAGQVESGPPADARRLGGLSAATELVTFADGSKAIRKSVRSAGLEDMQDFAAEQLASQLARALGLPAPAVYRDAEASLWMRYVGDALTADEGEGDPRFAGVPGSDAGRLMGLLDVLVNNFDRNGGNWMLDNPGRLVPIDHGAAWGQGIEAVGDDPLEYLHSPFVEHYRGRNLLTAADVAEVRRRLESLRPDFDHIGKGDWLDYSLRVLDYLGERASGTRDLIAGVR